MTAEFERWVDKCVEETDQQEPLWSIVHALGTSAAHFWLSRTFAEIEREAVLLANANSHGRGALPNFVDISEAFAAIKAKFGL